MARAWEFRADEDASMTVTLPPRDEIAAYHLFDEPRLVGGLVERAIYTDDERRRIADLAGRLARAARANRDKHGGIDAFMHEYGLTSEEGIILMCLAEALLRIPDKDTADALIAEKIGEGQWEKHLGASDSLFVNASTFGLMLTGRVVQARRRQGLRPHQRAQAPGRALRRALHPPGAAPGHAHPGRQFRARPHHRGGAAPRRAAGGARLPVLLRHAGRAGQDRGRRACATSSATWRRSRRSARPAPPFSGHVQALTGAAQHLDQAVGPAPALRSRQGGAPRPRAAAAPDRACLRRAPLRPRPHRRRRGAGPPRPDARPVRPGLHGPRAQRLAGPRHRRAGLRQARHSRAALAAAAVRAGQAAHPRAPRQGRLLGQRDQVGAGARASTTTRSSRARSTPTCPISPASS